MLQRIAYRHRYNGKSIPRISFSHIYVIRQTHVAKYLSHSVCNNKSRGVYPAQIRSAFFIAKGKAY